MIFSGPRDRFTKEELKALSQYMQHGGNILVMSSEGGD